MSTIETKPAQRGPAPPVEDGPDLEDRLELGAEWFIDHKNQILAVITAISVLILGAYLFRAYQHRQVERANDVLEQAESTFEKALDNPWASAERAKAMAESRTFADQVRTEFPGSVAARNALLLKGDSYFFTGDALGAAATNTAEAIRTYQDFLAEAKSPVEQATGYLALGIANENGLFLTGDTATYFQAAVDALERARKVEGAGFIAAEATLALSRVFTYNGQLDKARELALEVFKKRYEPQPKPQPGESVDRLQLRQIRAQARTFATGDSARTQLLSLGVDVEALERTMTSRAATPATR